VTQPRTPIHRTPAVRLVATLTVIVVAVWYVQSNRDAFSLLLRVDWRLVPGIAALALLSHAVNGRILRLLVRRLDVELDAIEWFGLTLVHSFCNYLPLPQAGSVARGVYLKQVRGLGYVPFTATVFVTYVGFLVTAGVLGLLGLGVLALSGGRVPWLLAAVFTALTAGALLLLGRSWEVPLLRAWRPFAEAMRNLATPRLLMSVAAWQVGLVALSGLALWLAFGALGREVGLAVSLMLALVAALAGVVNVTPGNFGVAEAAAWLGARLLGSDADEAVVAFTLYRLVAVVLMFVLTPWAIARLTRRAQAAPQ
jgi:uncharacterized membrane protein YbhN (UPF0104 family)